MAYSEKLAQRIRESLSEVPKVEEKQMFGGIAFMVNGKMCIGIIDDELMCRIGPDEYETTLEREGCREMDFTGRPMKGYVYVSEAGMKTKKDFNYWIELCLKFNKKAKSYKKPKRKK